MLEEIIKPTQVLINKNEERANGLVQEILEPLLFMTVVEVNHQNLILTGIPAVL